ncbi:armadillo-type protein [Roridomyces roridus]|uniref:Armadillo-type protein n=1 Tax=Roridomyces roridus TaxID=1738132 RepID=A0AAD7C6P3_9AGAR|nr:armadillo-type protein [Roridomyces roridus]
MAPKPLLSSGMVQSVSAEEVFQVMTAASSQDPAVFQASSARLKELLDMFGTYDALHEIAAQRAVPIHIRQQSIIQFKNAASSHWRSRKVLSDEHRIRIRTRCFSFLDEEDETIAECNQVIVSKIARIDYPNNWPNLVDDLLKIIDSTFAKRFADAANEDMHDTLVLRRSLKLLNAILKEFANAKMPNINRSMGTILAKSQVALCGYYSTLVLSSYLSNTTLSPRACTDILLGHLVYKCIVKLAIWLWNRMDRAKSEGIDSAASFQWISSIFIESANGLKQLVAVRLSIIENHLATGLASNPYASRSVDILTRHIRLLGKFFRRLQELSSPRFTSLPTAPDVVAWYWDQVVLATKTPPLIADSPEAPYPVRFLVQGMVLFKENLSQWKPVRKDGRENETVLSKSFVENAVETLIQQFMPLKGAELEEWSADPEKWVNDEATDNEQWDFEIRSCSERVLMQLSGQFPDFVAPLLLHLYVNLATKPAGNLQEIIQKEALYCAIGRCAIKLKTMIPFDQWLQMSLYQEVHNTGEMYPIIKRRIAWLIGKWVSDECTSPTNPLIWEILIRLLCDADTVVRLTAAIALRECIDTLAFDINVFAPHLPRTVPQLMKLLAEAETLEIKRRVDYTLNVVIEQSGERILDLVSVIVAPLPALWAAAGEDWLFKNSLLVTVTKLVEATKQQSISLTEIVVPLVREGMAPGNATHLDEDTMDLWLAALRNAPSMQSTQLVDLFPLAVSTLAINLDLLGKVMSIIESYFFLDGALILQRHALDLFKAFNLALTGAAIETNLKDMIIALNLLIQVAPSSLWGEPMHTSGLFSVLMKNIVDGESGAILLTEHIYLMSRIVMADRQMFLRLMEATASPAISESKLYEELLDRWWGTWDNMSEPRHRKLAAMGIAALVSTARQDVLQRLPGDIFNIWTDVLLELKEAQLAAVDEVDETGEQVLSPLNLQRHWELDEAPASYYQDTEGTSEFDRRKAVYDRDPVRTVVLTAYIAERLNEARMAYGPQAFDEILGKADPAVLDTIRSQLARG